MKTGKKWMLVMLAVALLATGAISANAESQNSSTKATIEFGKGVLAWDDAYPADVSSMNLDFGSHELPINDITYQAVGTENSMHSIRLRDSRKPALPWEVSVSMSEFINPGNNTDKFAGIITLKNTHASHENLQKASDFVIESNATGIPVMSPETAKRDVFSLSWKASNIALSLTQANALKVEEAAYTATLTWTLSEVP